MTGEYSLRSMNYYYCRKLLNNIRDKEVSTITIFSLHLLLSKLTSVKITDSKFCLKYIHTGFLIGAQFVSKFFSNGKEVLKIILLKLSKKSSEESSKKFVRKKHQKTSQKVAQIAQKIVQNIV